MERLNGYFHRPFNDSLAKALVRAKGAAAIVTMLEGIGMYHFFWHPAMRIRY